MATTSTPRIPFGWLLTSVGCVVLVFAGGYLTAAGRPFGLVLIAVAAVALLVARVASLPRRRPSRTTANPRLPRQRTGPTNTRRGHPAVAGRDRSEQRAVRNTVRYPRDQDRVG
jgi:hypothetical protein